ncbi:peptidoglycan-binding protein [Actinoplanes sp. NEAU-A12]|uniref:Peptidoglycan-binding protein n=1 Tax=Actinoplanes sandaracinus TaxID=3045177 RepID=A0ABT6X0L9_9ACTN|nr:peptidoglycan-binding protein [Actinoplanes sandaracinus]MDI6105557.1 peptidoglycan-binding protein [Actinoplanes sandaracinus]
MSDESRRRARRLPRVAGTGVAVASVVALAAAAGAAALGFGRETPAESDSGPEPPAATAEVTRRDLVNEATVDAKVTFGGATALVSASAGMVTWLAPVGTVIGRGDPVLRADERPVPLFYGSVPLFRPLADKAEGRDVRQIERNLRALGYVGFTADDLWTPETTKAVKRWQRHHELPETGTIEAGQIVFAPEAVRVAGHTVRPGASAAGELMTVTGTKPVVVAELEPGTDGWARPGVEVTVQVPEGPALTGKISSVRSAASGSSDDADQTKQVTVSVEDPGKLGRTADAPVRVRHVVSQREDVLTVPVAALLALAEGGYGVEVVEPAGTRVVAVELGLISDGQVEVKGEVEDGMTVGMPA